MDFDQIFRSFFGFRDPHDRNNNEFPENGHFGFFGPGLNPPSNLVDDDDDDNDGDSDNFPRKRGGFSWGRQSDDFADFDRQTREMFQQIEEMFKNFGLSDFHSNIPSIETTPNRRRISPRDEMLKQPDEQKEVTRPHDEHGRPNEEQVQPNNKESPVMFGDVFRSPWHWNIPALPTAPHEDRDLDEQVKDGRLEDILIPRHHEPQQPHFKSFSKSISIQTVRKPDGTVEQRRTETDSEGKVTTTVTSSDESQNPVKKDPTCRSKRHTCSKWPPHQNPNYKDSQKDNEQNPFMKDTPCRSKRHTCSRLPGHQNLNYEDSQKDSLFNKFFGSWR